MSREYYPDQNNSGIIDLRAKVVRTPATRTKLILDELNQSHHSLLKIPRRSSPAKEELYEVERWETPKQEGSSFQAPPRRSMFTPSRLQNYSFQLEREARKPYWRCPKPQLGKVGESSRSIKTLATEAPEELKTIDIRCVEPKATPLVGAKILPNPHVRRHIMPKVKTILAREVEPGIKPNVFTIEDDDLLVTSSALGGQGEGVSNPLLAITSAPKPGFLKKPSTSSTFAFASPVMRGPVFPAPAIVPTETKRSPDGDSAAVVPLNGPMTTALLPSKDGKGAKLFEATTPPGTANAMEILNRTETKPAANSTDDHANNKPAGGVHADTGGSSTNAGALAFAEQKNSEPASISFAPTPSPASVPAFPGPNAPQSVSTAEASQNEPYKFGVSTLVADSANGASNKSNGIIPNGLFAPSSNAGFQVAKQPSDTTQSSLAVPAKRSFNEPTQSTADTGFQFGINAAMAPGTSFNFTKSNGSSADNGSMAVNGNSGASAHIFAFGGGGAAFQPASQPTPSFPPMQMPASGFSVGAPPAQISAAPFPAIHPANFQPLQPSDMAPNMFAQEPSGAGGRKILAARRKRMNR